MPLTDDELAACAQWAEAECDAPLARLVAELRERRAAASCVAVVVMEPTHAALLPHLFATTTRPLLVVVPLGTRLRVCRDRQAPCTLETYDPAAPTDLRQRLRAHGLCG